MAIRRKLWWHTFRRIVTYLWHIHRLPFQDHQRWLSSRSGRHDLSKPASGGLLFDSHATSSSFTRETLERELTSYCRCLTFRHHLRLPWWGCRRFSQRGDANVSDRPVVWLLLLEEVAMVGAIIVPLPARGKP
uniref:Uncharacterized protein n=1 Tax=Setaria italica TaxID=4555 RepID=K3YK70_SETIT